MTHVEPFLAWVSEECGVRRFADLDLATMRAYRAHEATRTGKHGRRLSPFSVLDSHKALLTFLRWARAEGYEFEGRIQELKRPIVPKPEAEVYHMSQLLAILAACNRRRRRRLAPRPCHANGQGRLSMPGRGIRSQR